MSDVLGKNVREDQRDWDLNLPAMLMAYCISVNDSTLYTPFFLVHGGDPMLAMDTLTQPKYRYVRDECYKLFIQITFVLHIRTTHETSIERKLYLYPGVEPR